MAIIHSLKIYAIKSHFDDNINYLSLNFFKNTIDWNQIPKDLHNFTQDFLLFSIITHRHNKINDFISKFEDKKNELLTFAIGYGGCLEVIKYIIKFDIDKSNAYPLYYAITTDRLNIVKYLWENGFDIHKSDPYVLYNAVYYDKFEIIKYLIEQGVDPNNNISEHISAVNLSIIRYNYDISQYLIDNGASISILNDNHDIMDDNMDVALGIMDNNMNVAIGVISEEVIQLYDNNYKIKILGYEPNNQRKYKKIINKYKELTFSYKFLKNYFPRFFGCSKIIIISYLTYSIINYVNSIFKFNPSRL